MRVRIRCKGPTRGDTGTVPFTLHPTIADVQVFVVDADGTEKELEDVQAVSFKASADDGAVPVTACIRILSPELDVESMAMIGGEDLVELAELERFFRLAIQAQAELETSPAIQTDTRAGEAYNTMGALFRALEAKVLAVRARTAVDEVFVRAVVGEEPEEPRALERDNPKDELGSFAARHPKDLVHPDE